MNTCARRLAAVVTAALIALAGCSSDSKSAATIAAAPVTTDGSPTTAADTTAPTSTPETATSTTTETTATTETVDTAPDTAGTGPTASTSSTDVEAILQQLLLTPAEVGPTFVEDTYTGGSGSTPCGVDVDGQFPPVAKVGTQIANADPAVALVEEILVYDSEAIARSAFDLARTGFSCGTVQGVTFSTLTDTSDQLGLPSYAVSATSDAVEGVIFIALESDAVVVLQFQQQAGADVSGLPNPATITSAALQKIETLLKG